MQAHPLEDGRKYSIGVIGDIPALVAFWELFRDSANKRVLEEIGVVAAALPDQHALPGMEDPVSIPTYASFEAMLKDHPEINMVIEATGRQPLLERLRRELPPTITLVERAAANFFIRLLTSGQLWAACKADLMHTQAMLKTIVDQLSEDLLFLDRDGYIVDVNASVCARLGMTKRELMGREFNRLFQELEGAKPEDTEQTPFARTVATGEKAEGTVSQVDAKGRVRYFRVYTYPIFDEDGSLSHVVAFRRDITNRTHMELRLQQQEKLASIGELSTYIAHEIRNPLFAISGFANSLLRTAKTDEQSREKLGIILEESKRLDNILRSLLNFARPTEAREEEVDLAEVAKQVMDLMSIACENQSIHVHLEFGSGLPRGKADPELIKQCLINLVKNSMEAMPGGGELSVRTIQTRGMVCLEVEDTGGGIPLENRDKIFSPFFSTKGKGSGLGLAMVRKILDEIGGDVDLTSVEGEGTRIRLLVPVALAVAESAS